MMDFMRWICLLLPIVIFAKITIIEEPANIAPWFTGPIVASSATTVPAGHWNFELYFYATDTPANYNSHWKPIDQPTLWTLTWQPVIWAGVTDWMDIQLTPTWNWNHKEGAGHWTLSDLFLKFEFQLHRDQIPHTSWLPSIKLSFGEVFPIGKYQNASPKKHGTDLGGEGAYGTRIQLALGKLIHIKDWHWIQTRLNLNYQFSPPVHVKGINAYGGGLDTRGTVHPGMQFSFDYSLEYSLTRNWALAIDVIGNYQGTSHFTGKTTVSSSFPVSIQYSLAPAIEYNWNENLGIITGAWFTVAGKNSQEFYSFVFAVNYYK